LSENQKFNLKKVKMNDNDPAVPCGLVAKSYFNDTYLLTDPKGKNIIINDVNIAWESDRQYKFKNIQNAPDGKSY